MISKGSLALRQQEQKKVTKNISDGKMRSLKFKKKKERKEMDAAKQQ